jgi:hypothetical protein
MDNRRLVRENWFTALWEGNMHRPPASAGRSVELHGCFSERGVRSPAQWSWQGGWPPPPRSWLRPVPLTPPVGPRARCAATRLFDMCSNGGCGGAPQGVPFFPTHLVDPARQSYAPSQDYTPKPLGSQSTRTLAAVCERLIILRGEGPWPPPAPLVCCGAVRAEIPGYE